MGGAGRSLLVTAGRLRSDSEQALRNELLFSILWGSVLLGRLLLTSPSTKQNRFIIQGVTNRVVLILVG